ncbi:MAG: HEPN domain-containing protein [Gallionella sp.]|nr:HEPN domain-containing protein [Gallionella sp.]MDD4947014.1 HEPN domain-containing protein [Gallionella sp.]
MSDYATLKSCHRALRDGYPASLNLRVHRALSWLKRAELSEDEDGKFIFLWIAFNAAYAREIDETCRLSEQATFVEFLQRLCALDQDKRIDGLAWKEFSGPIRLLLDTPFVFQSFWDWHAGKISEAEWSERFEKGKKTAQRALVSGNTPALLGVVFNRLYTLRNQLIHGGATWNSKVNRKQLHDCARLLGKLVPAIIGLMLDHPEIEWGAVCYPVVDAT